jgi:hypothetical protein
MGPHALAQAFADSLNQPQVLRDLLHDEAVWLLPPALGTAAQVGRDAIVAFRERLYTDVLEGKSVEVDVEDVLVTGQQIVLRAG